MPDLEAAAAQVTRGNIQAFGQIVDATSRDFVRLAARLVGSLSEAEDVVQDAYVKAYQALAAGRFDGRSAVKTWLYSIVTRTAIDALRRTSRRATSSEKLDDKAAEGIAPEAHMALLELSSWLEVLPAEQRAAIVLTSIQGFSSKEAAALLGCSEGALEQRLVRGRMKLRASRGGQ